MPICQQLNFEHSQFAVWKITEKLDELIALLPDYIDISTKLNNTKNEKRKFELVCEYLLLHHLLNKPFELCHKENGSPYLKNSNKFITISHTIGYVAVGIADTRIGADIEIFRNKVLNILDKFLTDKEKKLIDTQNLLEPLIIWCCKESIFKYAPLPLYDFSKDINILEISKPHDNFNINKNEIDLSSKQGNVYFINGEYMNNGFMTAISLNSYITNDYILSVTKD